VDAFASLEWAVWSSIVFAVFDVFFSHYTLKTWDPGSIAALALLGALGWVTLGRKDPLWVKLQPAFLGVGMALFIAYSQFFGQPLLQRYLPLMRRAVPPDMLDQFDDPIFLTKLNRAVTGLAVVLVLHAALVTFAAYRLSNVAWLTIRAVGLWILIFVMLIAVMAV
jgi:hypothetical protein